MTPHPHFIAFDVAKRCGIAYRSGNEWLTMVIDPSDTHLVQSMIATAKQCAGVTAAVLEDCYLAQNPMTFKHLAATQGRLQLLCEQAGLSPVLIVSAAEWHANYHITGSRDDCKLGARRVAQLLGAKKTLTQDEYDAICLCDYASAVTRHV